MATETHGTVTDLLDVKGALEHGTAAARKATEDALELYVKSVDELAAAEVKAARATKLPVVATIAETHASLGREVAKTYATTVRDLLKA